MGERSAIEWTDSTWNPTRGCSRVSPGCVNCYAERFAGRFAGPGELYEGYVLRTPSGPRWTGVVDFLEDKLDAPLRWKAPRRIFVNSMSDLFHEGLTFEDIAAVFGVMLGAPRHTFQVLTKRAERMEEWFAWIAERLGGPAAHCRMVAGDAIPPDPPRRYPEEDPKGYELPPGYPDVWPLKNVWMGVSVENQERADERIPHLLHVPAAVRFLSCEPLLGPVVLDLHEIEIALEPDGRGNAAIEGPLHWVIVGGESGKSARPMHPDWARAIRDECQAAGVPFFFKQWGEWAPRSPDDGKPFDSLKTERHALVGKNGLPNACRESAGEGYACMSRVGKKAAGALLDGREWKEFPRG
jgi:protein gp37